MVSRFKPQMHAPQPAPSPPGAAATGEAAEDRALRYLQARGLSVIARNYRCKTGEIDLVMRDVAGTLVFVEVRARVARSAQRFGGAAASVTPAKQRRLIAAPRISSPAIRARCRPAASMSSPSTARALNGCAMPSVSKPELDPIHPIPPTLPDSTRTA